MTKRRVSILKVDSHRPHPAYFHQFARDHAVSILGRARDYTSTADTAVLYEAYVQYLEDCIYIGLAGEGEV